MRYTVKSKGSAASELRKLSRDIKERVIKKIASLEENPRQHGSEKLKGDSDLYRVRVGDYRIVYNIDDACATIIITRIAHRREVYN
jgi:mRNA interferase RelE/StbE